MEYQSGAVGPVESFSKGWDIIKNDYWMYVLMVLIFGVIVIVASLILGFINTAITNVIAAAMGVAATNSGDIARASAAIIPQVIAQIIGIFTSIITATLSGVLLCGIYKSLSRVSNGGARAEVGDLFSGFEHIQACLIYAVIISVIQFVIAIVMLLGFAAVGFSAVGLGVAGLIKDGQIDPAIIGGLLAVMLSYFAIVIVLALIIGALTVFVYPLIGERNLSGIQAFGLSVKGGLANIGGLILLLILGGLMLFAGALPCLLGLPFLAPIYIAALFAAYQSVFGRVGGYQNYNPPPPPNFGNRPGF